MEQAVIHSGGPLKFAQRCKSCFFSSVWIRIGYGPRLDKNFTSSLLPAVRNSLRNLGIQLWGWHVPRCATTSAATDEAKQVCDWIDAFKVDGLLWDAEEPQNGRYFLGGSTEAIAYANAINSHLLPKGVGIALSSHDEPSVHLGFPFDVFLKYAIDNCPQVYYTTGTVASRLDKSIKDYRRLEVGRNFVDRYKPVGNITVHSDVPLPSTQECLKKASDFLRLVSQNGFLGYGFWCWDDAPREIFDFFSANPDASLQGAIPIIAKQAVKFRRRKKRSE